jgi:hypothetical protein
MQQPHHETSEELVVHWTRRDFSDTWRSSGAAVDHHRVAAGRGYVEGVCVVAVVRHNDAVAARAEGRMGAVRRIDSAAARA